MVTDPAPPTTTNNAEVMVSGSILAGRGSGRTLPLNLRCLTAPLLRQLAAGLRVPSTASQVDLLPMMKENSQKRTVTLFAHKWVESCT